MGETEHHDHERVISAACAYRQACRALDRNKNYGAAGRNQMAKEAIKTMRALFVAVDAMEGGAVTGDKWRGLVGYFQEGTKWGLVSEESRGRKTNYILRCINTLFPGERRGQRYILLGAEMQ